MKRLFQVVSALALSALLAAPALATSGFKVDMYCEGPGSGAANIASNGNLTINMNNLPPNSGWECGVFCFVGDFFEGWCATDNKGHFSASFPNAVDTCIAPIVFVDYICASGVID
jgi:hypothetical protein